MRKRLPPWVRPPAIDPCWRGHSRCLRWRQAGRLPYVGRSPPRPERVHERAEEAGVGWRRTRRWFASSPFHQAKPVRPRIRQCRFPLRGTSSGLLALPVRRAARRRRNRQIATLGVFVPPRRLRRIDRRFPVAFPRRRTRNADREPAAEQPPPRVSFRPREPSATRSGEAGEPARRRAESRAGDARLRSCWSAAGSVLKAACRGGGAGFVAEGQRPVPDRVRTEPRAERTSGPSLASRQRTWRCQLTRTATRTGVSGGAAEPGRIYPMSCCPRNRASLKEDCRSRG